MDRSSTERHEAADAAGGARPRLRLEDPARSASKQQQVAKLWRDGSLCDVEIVVENQTFRAHRVILAVGSDFLSALFCDGRFKDSSTESINLEEVTAASFRLLLDWMYDGKCDMEETEVMDLLEAASRMQCTDLIGKLEDAIADNLTADTCLEAWDTAERMRLAKLTKAAEAKALDCYDELTSTNEFEALPAYRLSKLLASNRLRMKDEEAVFTSVVSWTKAQSTQPSADDLRVIFDNVRFPLMSEAFINECVVVEKLVKDNPTVLMSFARSMNYAYFRLKNGSHALQRRLSTCTWDDIKPGVRVRVKDNLNTVKTLCKRIAPGANEAAGWGQEKANYTGREFIIKIIVPDRRSVSIEGWHFPFDAVELA